MMNLKKENTLAVVIDIQEKLLPHMQNSEQLLQKSISLVKGLEVLNIPIAVTQQYTKGLGNTVAPISESMANFSFIEKLSFSCFREPNFVSVLDKSLRPNIIICGIESHVCVLQTALDLINAGFNVMIVADCISSRNAFDMEIALKRMQNAGCIITTLESVLFELTIQAGTPEFKEISKLIK